MTKINIIRVILTFSKCLKTLHYYSFQTLGKLNNSFFPEYVYKCAFSYLPLVENVENGPISKILSDSRF